MSDKLRCVLLIDDNASDNFLHKRILRRANCAAHIEVFESASEALAQLTEPEMAGFPRPELILRDINMPGMTGWEFIEAHAQLPANSAATSSLRC